MVFHLYEGPVMKLTQYDRKTIRMPKPFVPHNKGKVGEITKVAERYGIHRDTLKYRSLKNPDVPLEELAKRPVLTKKEASRLGTTERWRRYRETKNEQ